MTLGGQRTHQLHQQDGCLGGHVGVCSGHALCTRTTLERVSVHVEKRIKSLDWDWVDAGVGVAGFWDTDEGLKNVVNL